MAVGFELAQINIGRLIHPHDAPEARNLVDSLDRINALADAPETAEPRSILETRA